MKNVFVIGGGIAGLSAAYYTLKKSAEQNLAVRVTVLESGMRWGGKICTEQINGFVIEGGPDSFLASKPQAVALCHELGLDGYLQGTNPDQRNTYILHDGHLLPLPDGLIMMVPTNFRSIAASRLLSWPQKARMALDLVLPPPRAGGDESVGAFISRRLGRAAYENMIQPLLSGIYTGDGDMLSLASTFPALADMEQQHGSLFRAALARKLRARSAGEPGGHSRSAFLTPTGGLSEMIAALVAGLERAHATLCLNTRVLRISTVEKQFVLEIDNGSPLQADAVILATPAPVSAVLLASLDPTLAADLQSIPYTSTATVSLAYRESDIVRELDGYGYLIPRRAGRPALACTWTSTKFAQHAPEGYALLRVFIGCAGQDLPHDENELLALARTELRLTLGIEAVPVLSRVFRWDQGMPQYNLGHPDCLLRIEQAMQKHPHLALAGGGYKGVGIPDCILSGERAAEKIVTGSIETSK